ncbi:thioredoxin domain-containing protein 11 [Diorhabda carinulata]|uniref:thioredoxin domain-containing protein 11 n=1 Tax=Diorhabda carinulata TaxID=1163345 RepID=UPI0025A1BE24|nr:thioredoxin domain-containing protein 11 [Diorhabda carinulata]
MSLLKLKTKEAKVVANCHDSVDNVISNFDSDSANDSDNSEIFKRNKNREDNRQFPTLTMRMLNLCREFAIFCLVMMTYAALSKDPPKISKSPAAYHFFSEKSIVTDSYRGQISKVIENARSNDIVFVMFYAPWDADSQRGRNEFEKAAHSMQDKVNFIAINCWQPHGECRTKYNRVYKWPVLIAYLPHGRSVHYNGLLSAPHIVQFLKKVCNPIKHAGKEAIKNFQDGYVKAELNTSPGSLDFAVFYVASLKYLEKDPQFRITFYVNPSLVSPPKLYLYLWNETLVFPNHELSWTPHSILQWLFQSTHQVTSWVLPTGSKSIALSSSMHNGPVLILFTPKNPLHSNNDYYNMLQEIAQEYHSCDENIFANVLAVHLQLKRTANLLLHKQLMSSCTLNTKLLNSTVMSHTNPVWANVSACSHKTETEDCDLVSDQNNRHVRVQFKTENSLEHFSKVVTGKDPCNDKIVNTEKFYKTSILTGFGDYRSAENLQKLHEAERCKDFLEAEKQFPAVFVKDSSLKNITITGLSCRSNKSLSMLAMDSLLYSHFALRLGIDLSKEPDRTAVVILNDKMESHYILEQPITSDSLKEFISNFSKNHLNRSFSSATTLSSASFQKKKENESRIVVEELDTNTFLPTVLQDDNAVVVFYYSKQCSFCNGISYIFLTVAKKLAFLRNLVFARIDGDINILPWEYTMETYPTILFFPPKRKSESRAFPPDIAITVQNIISFLLVNLEPNLKLQALWYLCIQTTAPKEHSSCYSTLLGETLSLIDSTLKEWRKSHTLQRQVLLHRLKSLRQLHLLFAHAQEKQSAILDYLNKIHSNLRFTKDFDFLKQSKSIIDEL